MMLATWSESLITQMGTFLPDLLRVLLVIGLFYAIWAVRVRGTRPVRGFVLWGLRYPPVALILVAFTLMIWGLIGDDYGLQSLFLDDHPVIQFVAGMAVSLLFLSIIFWFYLLDRQVLRQSDPVRMTIRALMAIRHIPLLGWVSGWVGRGLLRNNYLEDRSRFDLSALNERLDQLDEQGRRGTPRNELPLDLSQFLTKLHDHEFRFKLAPAVLSVYGLMILVLLGVIPFLIIPLLTGHAEDIGARPIWFIAVLLGYAIGVLIAVFITKSFKFRPAEAGAALESESSVYLTGNEVHRGRSSMDVHAEVWRCWVPSARHWLICFFLVHLLAFQWLEPKLGTILGVEMPWSALIALACEAVLAVILLALYFRLPRGLVRHLLGVAGGLAFLFPFGYCLWLYETRGIDLLYDDLGGWHIWFPPLAFAALFLLICQACFGLSVVFGRRTRPDPGPLYVSALAACCLLGLFFSQASYPLLTLGAGGLGAVVIATGPRTRPAIGGLLSAALLGLALLVFTACGLLITLNAGRSSNLDLPTRSGVRESFLEGILAHAAEVAGSLVSFWIALLIVVVAGYGLARVARNGGSGQAERHDYDPYMVFPLGAIFGFVAFAVFYNGLPTWLQLGMPAALSITCAAGLVAAIYASIRFAHPRRRAAYGFAFLLGLVLLNGTTVGIPVNDFKLTFPGLDGDEIRRPLLLDSRAYFRTMAGSSAKIRYDEQLKKIDVNRSDNTRLATIHFEGAEVEEDRLLLTFRDDHQHLRLLEWDSSTEGDEALIYLRTRHYGVKDRQESNLALTDIMTKEYLNFLNKSDSPSWIEPDLMRSFCSCSTSLTVSETILGDEIEILHDHTVDGRNQATAKLIKWDKVDREIRLPAEIPASLIGRVGITTRWRGIVRKAKPLKGVPARETSDKTRNRFTLAIQGLSLGLLGDLTSRGTQINDTLGRTLNESHLIIRDFSVNINFNSIVLLNDDNSNDAFAIATDKFEEGRGLRAGATVAFEDVRGENPSRIGLYEFSSDGRAAIGPVLEANRLGSDFRDYVQMREMVGKRFRKPPTGNPFLKAPKAAADELRLREVGDAGFWQLEEPGADFKLSNAGRLRPEDRLILSWEDENKGRLTRSRLFAVTEAPRFEAKSGHYRVNLKAIDPDGAWTPTPPDPDNAWGRDRPELKNPGRWQLYNMLDNLQVLSAWRETIDRLRDVRASADPPPTKPTKPTSTEPELPKLAIVTVSGGGIRSSVWTAAVLKQLQNTMGPAFPYHIRLITGASGGMVGGSYYAATLRDPAGAFGGQGDAPNPDLLGQEEELDTLVRKLGQNQLPAVAGQMAFSDIPSLLNPFRQASDRGRKLEETWAELFKHPASVEAGNNAPSPFDRRRPLQSYAADEWAGWRPSLVYTPMLVEDGRRLLISNLDLQFVTRNVGGMILERSSRRIDHLPLGGLLDDGRIDLEDDLYSLSAIELFRLFPNAHDFRLSTAARMSASFPFVSPAVSLPTYRPRRVVDAGYYDNYGVNVAALWIAEMREWLVANTSGVVIIQIRDYASQEARGEIGFDRDTEGSGSPISRTLNDLTLNAWKQVVSIGLQPLTSPLRGMSTARSSNMSFRNDEQVEMLDELFKEQGEASGDPSDQRRMGKFFRTIVFECPVEVSLNWRLSREEKEIILKGFGEPKKSAPKAVDLYGTHNALWDHLNYQDGFDEEKQKAIIARELLNLGFDSQQIDPLSPQEAKLLFQNVTNNRKRLNLLEQWWHNGPSSND